MRAPPCCSTRPRTLTLSAAAADLAEERALTEMQEPLLSDQLQELRLQLLSQLPGVRAR